MTRANRSLLLLTLSFTTTLAPACLPRADRGGGDSFSASVTPPMSLDGSAYEAAARFDLPELAPSDGPGLQHVFKLSDSIISGAEPTGREALSQIASWGVKTILSVDGKVPEVEWAAELGMRYVHVPIEYSGMDGEELLKICKTFRELEGPFYVHCFHGKHRGPAAAAIGRIVRDGIPRERAIAEMRQWCATASKYEGLYSTVATAPIPSAAESAGFEFGFDPAHSFEGLRGAMVHMTRKWDLIKAAKKRNWQADPEHPDIVPLQEAVQLHELFESCSNLEEIRAWPDDFRAWLEEGRSGSEQLLQALMEASAASAAPGASEPSEAAEPEALSRADSAYARVSKSCSACHKSYRN